MTQKSKPWGRNYRQGITNGKAMGQELLTRFEEEQESRSGESGISTGRPCWTAAGSPAALLRSLNFILSLQRSLQRDFNQKSNVILFILERLLWLLHRELIIAESTDERKWLR